MPFPSSICYESQSMSFVNGSVFSRFHSGNSRLRQITGKNSDIYEVSAKVTGAQLQDFREFVIYDTNHGENEYTATYFVGDTEKTGAALLLSPDYDVQYLAYDVFQLSWSFIILNRDLSEENTLYDAVILNGGFS